MRVHEGQPLPVSDLSNLTNPHANEGFLLEIGQPTYTALHGSVEVNGAESQFTLNVPSELRSSRVMVYVNGFGAFKKTMRGIANETAELGYANLRCSPIRRTDRSWKEDWEDPTQVHVDHLAAIVDKLSDSKVLRGAPNGRDLNTDKLVVAPHSYGGDTGVRFGLEYSESVEDLIMLMPVGMEDADTFRLAKRFPAFFVKELLPFLISKNKGLSLGDGKKAIKHFFEDPIQTAGEMRRCMEADNRMALHEFRAKGIGTALLSGRRDNLLPAKRMETVAQFMVDHYDTVDVNHLGPQQKPKVVAEATVKASRVLVAQRASASTGLTPAKRA